MMNDLRGKAAMVGAATAGMGKAPEDQTLMELGAETARAALARAGLRLSDVDGVFGVSMARLMWTVDLSEYLGLDPRFVDGTQLGGGSFEAHCLSAAMALDAGMCDVALICFSAKTRSERGPWPNIRGDLDPYYGPFGAEGMTTYAMAAARHMHEYGTTREQMAAVAVAARQWANENPKAFYQGDLTIEDVISSKMITSPLTVRDCCLITDGAGAVVMVRAEQAREYQDAAWLLGAGIGLSHMDVTQMPDLTETAAKQSGARAYSMAGLGPEDIDVIQLYDAFTINVILFLEDLGFCAKGEGGALVESGAIAPGGNLPVNTNGGGLSCVHPGMYGIFMLVEAFEQLSGDAASCCVEGAQTVLCHGNGGGLSAQVTTIWSTEV
jgi:acetyl-CoA acetyltransferase